MKKPSIPDSHPPTREHMSHIKQSIEIVIGRRGGRCSLDQLRTMEISDPPTQAQVDFIRLQLINLIGRIEG